MNQFQKGDRVRTRDGALVTFVAYTSKSNPASAIIKIGDDTRVVDATSLTKVAN